VYTQLIYDWRNFNLIVIYILLIVTTVILMITSGLANRLNHQLTDGTLLSTRDFADFMVKIADFNQAHPQAKQLTKRYQRCWRWQAIILMLSGIIGIIWVLFLTDLDPVILLILIVMITLAATITTVITTTSYYRLTKIYTAHQLQLKLAQKTHAKLYFYSNSLLVLLLNYEFVAVESQLFDFLA